MSARILGDKDVNAAIEQQSTLVKDVKSMDYHRQVFQSKMAQEPYVIGKSTVASAAVNKPSPPSTNTTSITVNTTTTTTATTTNTSSASSTSSSPSPTFTVLRDAPPPVPLANPRFAFSAKQYVSPSDNIMSPCSAKINALRNKQVTKYV